MSNFVEESVNQVNDMNTGVDVDPVLNGVRNRDRNFQRNSRVYKHSQNNRSEMSNLYSYSSSYQNQQYSNNWSENVQFDQPRLSSYSSNYQTTYPTNTSTYPANTSSYPATNTTYPSNTTSYPANTSSNSSYVHAYSGTMPLVGDNRMSVNGNMPTTVPMNTSQVLVDQALDSSTLEEIAYFFTYKYYSMLNNNPTYMYSLYSKEAQLSKTDASGNRVVASDHNEIRNYYQQFVNYVITSNIHNIEIQLVSSHPLFLVLITGSFTLANEKTNTEQTKLFAQTVLLSGDVSRSRYHIINDLLTELNTLNTHSTTTLVHTSHSTTTPEQPHDLKSQDYHHDSSRSLRKDSKDGFKIAIFGIPPMVTEVILTEIINKRLTQLNSDGKVVDVAIKPQKVNRKSNESLLYAFVELDSPEAVETLLANDLQIQDRNITLEPYKRTEKKREFKPKNTTSNY
uniref:NTF2 domain-containing protein n=1 Tax=Theileria annulata TaxID=5874 RepID=A0A3B0MT78_THEAN